MNRSCLCEQLDGVDYMRSGREIYNAKGVSIMVDLPLYHPGVRIVKRSRKGSNIIESYQVDSRNVVSHCTRMSGIELDFALPLHSNVSSLDPIDGSSMLPFAINYFPSIPENSSINAFVNISKLIIFKIRKLHRRPLLPKTELSSQ